MWGYVKFSKNFRKGFHTWKFVKDCARVNPDEELPWVMVIKVIMALFKTLFRSTTYLKVWVSQCIPWRHKGESRHSSIIINLNTRQSEWSASSPGHFGLDENNPTNWRGGWQNPSGRFGIEKICNNCLESKEDSIVVQSVAYSLYQLSYPESWSRVIRENLAVLLVSSI